MKLDVLIQKLCPDGVNFTRLIDIADILYGYPCDASKFNEDGNGLPLVRIRDVLAGETTTYTTEIIPQNYIVSKGDLLVGMDGNFHVSTWKMSDSVLCQRVCRISPKDEAVTCRGFLNHLLPPIIKDIEQSKQSGTVKHLLAKDINSIKIPLPPLPVQQEIVRILDSFTELTAELTARRKQYEHYRDELLTFGEDVERKILGDVIVSLNTGLNPRQFFKLNTEGANNYYVTIREIQNNTVVMSEKTDRIDDFALQLCNNRSNLEIGDVLFSGTGTIGETAIITEYPYNWNIKEGVYTIKPQKEKLNSKFLMYLLHTEPIRTAILKKAAGGTVKSVPVAEMKRLLIPIPPLDKQLEIVSILNRFDALCNDLTSGLPAEIAARQKQYEYYRDKLLTFKELTV